MLVRPSGRGGSISTTRSSTRPLTRERLAAILPAAAASRSAHIIRDRADTWSTCHAGVARHHPQPLATTASIPPQRTAAEKLPPATHDYCIMIGLSLKCCFKPVWPHAQFSAPKMYVNASGLFTCAKSLYRTSSLQCPHCFVNKFEKYVSYQKGTDKCMALLNALGSL